MGLVGAAMVGQLQLGAVITKAAVEQPLASVAVKLLFMLLVRLTISNEPLALTVTLPKVALKV